MLSVVGEIQSFHNPRLNLSAGYPEHLKKFVDTEETESIRAEIRRWPGYAETPLVDLGSIAKALDIEKIWYKDESQRFDLKSFKALGGAYATARQLQKFVSRETNKVISIHDLLGGRYDRLTGDLVMTCATDGNHGRSVAWGCKLFGCRCVIYIHRDVSAARASAMEALGAEVVRINGNYDDSVRRAAEDAITFERTVISDTSYPGYVDIPRDVTMGYTVMLAEIVEQLAGEKPTHVFIQAGVGGLAAMVCGYFWHVWRAARPRIIVVEPEAANCLQESARKGEPVVVEGELSTLMAGLACGEVSFNAWQILDEGASDFVTVSESAVIPTMKLLARGVDDDQTVEAGESAVAGMAALILSRQSAIESQRLGIGSGSRVLLIGTEGATDPALYRALVAR